MRRQAREERKKDWRERESVHLERREWTEDERPPPVETMKGKKREEGGIEEE